MRLKALLYTSLISLCTQGQERVVLDRRTDNGLYIKDATMFIGPGDTVQLTGKYTSFKIYNIRGTKERPIVFINKGLVVIDGGMNNMVILSGSNFKFLGNGDTKYKYGIHISPGKMLYPYFGVQIENATNIEVAFCDISKVTNGILQVPAPAAQAALDCSFHDNYIHDIGDSIRQKNSCAILLGNAINPFSMDNCSVKDNILENLAGNGIQVINGTFNIENNQLKNFGKANMPNCRSGIVLGEAATGNILHNDLDSADGTALLILGHGKIEVKNNTFRNIHCKDPAASNIVFIQTKQSQAKQLAPLNISFQNNKVTASTADNVVCNATLPTLTSGSVFSNNTINGSFKKKFKLTSKDVLK